MKPLRQLFFSCCLLPLLWAAANAQPAHQGDIGRLTSNRIETQSDVAAEAASAVVNGDSTAADGGETALTPTAPPLENAVTDGNLAADKAVADTPTADGAVADNPAAGGAAADGAASGDETKSTSMQSDPLMIIIITLAAAYIFRMWVQDYRANQAGTPNTGAFPGATPATAKVVFIAIAGALILLAAETAGEIALGISGEQSDMTVLMLFSVTAAAFFEELIFRGYLVVSNKGRALLVGSIFGFSVLFALIHPFLWDITTPEGIPGWQVWNADWEFHFDSAKAWFSTFFVLANSLWFYAMRFAPLNPARSLIPCIAAHLAMNWGVFLVKLAQGHVTALF